MRRDGASRPTVVRVGGGRSGLARNTKFIRRGGIYPARSVCGGPRFSGRCKHRPLQMFVVTPGYRFPGGRAFAFVRRGGIYCARRRVSEANRRTAAALRPEIPPGALRRRRVPGTMQASSPTEVCYNAGPRFLGWPRHSPSSVGADSISARGCLPRRRVRRDEGIPPYGRPEGGGRPCLAPNTEFIRRGGIYPARGTLRRRGVRRDGGIPPYGRPVGCGCPVSRVMFGRFVVERHAPPAGPCRTANIHGRAMALPYEPAQMPPPSGWCETQNLFVGADSISARGLAATQGSRDDLRPKSRACGPVGLRNAPAGAVQASSPTGAAIPQPAVFPPFGPGVCAAARSFQNSVFLRRPRLSGRFCFARVCAAGGRHIVGQGARGTVCARCPKTGRFAARAAILPACPAVAR